MANFLHEITQPIHTGFQLTLSNNTDLECQQVVRVIPQRRLVCRGVWQAQPVFAKLFLGADAKKYAARDASGVASLCAAEIETPPLLWQGESTKYDAQVLIFAAISPSVNAEEVWRNANLQQRANLAQRLSRTIAEHHQANLIQTDIHLKNFLVANNQIFTLDGDGIRQTNSASQKQRNLATLFSKFDVLDDDFMQESVEIYCKAIGKKFSHEFFAKIFGLTQDIRQKTASDYADKKVFRTCTDVKVTQNRQHFLAVSNRFNAENKLSLKNSDLENISSENQWVNDIDVFLNVSVKNLKNGNTCTIGLAEIHHKKVVIKRYNIKNFWHGFKLAFRQSRAAKSWANAHRLQIFNIATPQPLALIEEKNKFLAKRSYFLSEFVDAPDIATFFAIEKDLSIKQSVALETAKLFYKLSLLNISHGDCKANNIKIMNNQPMLLDLDSMRVHKNNFFFDKQHVRDLKRLMKNWENNIEVTTLLKNAFKLGYDGEDVFSVPSALIRAGIA